MILPIFSIIFMNRQLNFLSVFACRSLSSNVLVGGHVQCCCFAVAPKDSLRKPQRSSWSVLSRVQEPANSKCYRLASELSTMKQDPSESVDEFAFKYKNILHKLDKLGESLNKSCPTYVTSQFIPSYNCILLVLWFFKRTM